MAPVTPSRDESVPPSTGAGGIPRWLDLGAAIGWRLLILAAVVLVVGTVLLRLLVVVVPIVVALFLATVLTPPSRWLRRHGWPPALATWAVFLAAVVVLAGLLAWMVPSISHQISQVGNSADRGTRQVEDWLVRGPLHMSRRTARKDFKDAGAQLSQNAGGYALTGATIAGEVVAGLLLSLVLTFFFVKDGSRIGESFLRFVGDHHADDLREVGRRAWETLSGYIRGTTVNGIINGALLGIGLVIIGVPLAAPLAVLTFFGAYFPIVGAIVTGLLAALVALVSNGPVAALVVIALTVLIHNVEGYLVGPLVLGRAVRLHAIAILLALAIGGAIAGIVGAFVAVPTTAVIATTVGYYRERDRAATDGADGPDPPPAGSAGD